jgi:DUF4097 and DUF4098 domain-containing protein YvlB
MSCITNGIGNDNYMGNDNEPSFTKEYAVTTPLNMKVVTSGGNITVSGYNGDSAIVDFIVRRNGQVLKMSLEELKNIAEVEITNESNLLEIVVERPEKRITVGFNIKVPKQTSCILKTSGGNLSVSKVIGDQEVRTSGGNLSLISITGKVEAHTSGGNIDIKDQKGDILVKTSGGNIDAEDIDGRLEAHTSGGNVDIMNSKFDVIASTSGGEVHLDNVSGNIETSTSGGSIKMNGISGSVTASTSGGSIDADFIKVADPISLKTSGGDIELKIPDKLGLNLNLHGNHVKADLKNFTGQAAKDKVVGEMNGGGIYVNASTSGGSVSVNFK